MKKAICILLLFFSINSGFANHIIGGEMTYKYLGPGDRPNSNKYKITLTLFKGDNTNGANLDEFYQVAIFNNYNFGKVFGTASPNRNWWIFAEGPEQPVPVTVSPCIYNAPEVNFVYRNYSLIVDLTESGYGYTVTFQTYARQSNIINMSTEGKGATFTCEMPGNRYLGPDVHVSSPKFSLPVAVVCANSKFSIDFSATDIDGNILTYFFTTPYGGGDADKPDYRNPAKPLYEQLSYMPGYSFDSPLGPNITIDPNTGEIKGISGEEGIYLVSIQVVSERPGPNGLRLFVSQHRKDLVIKVFGCQTPTAIIGPLPPTQCDSFNVAFTNGGNNPPGTLYHWTFDDPASGVDNTSSEENPTHLFTAAGDYNVKLVTDINGQCGDEITKLVKVYPGFYPAFEILGKCAFNDTRFNDKSVADYGTVNSWLWNFGDFADRVNNTSTLKNAIHKYPNAGGFPIKLTVTSSKGCTATKDTLIKMLDKPPLELTNDTLICSIDTLQINAVGDGTVIWTPNYMINNTTSFTPLVSPDVTTTYQVQLTDPFGCVGSDSVKIKVVDFVTLTGPNDTTICQTDPIVLNINSDALYYTWTPDDGSISNTISQNPTVTPVATTNYHIRASISAKCFAEDDILVTAVPYPKPAVGPDIPVCIGFSTQLHASGGAYYGWSPAIFLSANNIPDPKVINPTSGVRYVVSVRDTLGCPKVVTDTVLVNVIRIKADAGPADTSVVINQPLQLTATGGTSYSWSPDKWLSSSGGQEIIALPEDDIRYTVTVSDDNGCIGTDNILVKLYKLDPGLYLPNAFTPNGDNINDRFEPIELGLKSLDIFRVYNRWGKLIYQTSDMRKGWDGTLGGKDQEAGTYVWYAEGTDHKGKQVKKKGTAILLRQ